jgi:hypothetical protein
LKKAESLGTVLDPDIIEYGAAAIAPPADLAAVYLAIAKSVEQIGPVEWAEYPHIITAPRGWLGWYGTARRNDKQRIDALTHEVRRLKDRIQTLEENR